MGQTKWIKYAIPASALVLFSGCAFTRQGAIMEMAPIYQKQAEIQAQLAAKIAEAIAKTQRGGMELVLDKDGRVAKIVYREHLDMSAFKQALAQQKLPDPGSPAQDYAAFLTGTATLVTPLAAMYFGYKTNHDNTWAQVSTHNSDNLYNFKTWDIYTSRYQNHSETTTETVVWPPKYMVKD